MLGTGNHGRQENLPLAPSVEEGGEEEVLKSRRGFWESYMPRRQGQALSVYGGFRGPNGLCSVRVANRHFLALGVIHAQDVRSLDIVLMKN